MTSNRRHAKRELHRVKPPTTTAPKQKTTLATAVEQLRDARHLAAMAESLASRLMSDFTLTSSPPAFLIRTAEGSTEQASETAILELQAVLQDIAARAKARVDRLLACTAETPGPEKVEMLLFIMGEEKEENRDWSASAARRDEHGRRPGDLP